MNTEMSVNEAIERLRAHMRVHKMSEPRAHYINTAFEMAIDALKKQIERYDVKLEYYEQLLDRIYLGKKNNSGKTQINKEIDKNV